LAQHLAELALHRQWTFAALLASGDGDIVEALAGLREKEGIGVLQSQIAAHIRIGDDEAVSQLRQNHLERVAEAIQYANAVLQRNHAVAVAAVVSGCFGREGEFRLRVFGVHEERRAAVNIAAEQTQTFVSRVPRLYDNVIQLVAQEVVYNV